MGEFCQYFSVLVYIHIIIAFKILKSTELCGKVDGVFLSSHQPILVLLSDKLILFNIIARMRVQATGMIYRVLVDITLLLGSPTEKIILDKDYFY